MKQDFKLKKLSQQSYSLYVVVQFLYLTFMPIYIVYGLIVSSYFYGKIYWTYIFLIVSLYLVARYLFIKAHKRNNQPKQFLRILELGDSSQISSGLQSQQLKNQQHTNDKIKLDVLPPTEQDIQKNKIDKNLSPNQIRKDKNPNDRPPKFFCRECKIKVPYRARHCRDCNLCTLRFDHHCFWLGNCVGQNNHRYFYFLVWVQFIHSVVCIYFGWNLFYIVEGYIVLTGYFCFVWLVFLFLFTLYLVIFNTFLISKGLTTWQLTRRNKITYLNHLNQGYNPFTKGIYQNFKSFLLQKWEEQNAGQDWPIPTYGQAQYLGLNRSARI